MSRAVRLVRAPLAHFFVLGAMLALVRTVLPVAAADDPRVIVVTPAVADRLAVTPAVADRLAAAGSAPAGGDASLLDRWLDDEVLYREGLRLGLAWNPSSIARLLQVGRFVGEHDGGDALADVARFGLGRDDPVVRAQVIGQMRLHLLAAGRAAEPTDEQLERHLASHLPSFARPAVVTFSHVFVRRDRAAPAETLEAIRERIRRESLPADQAARLGDVFQPGTSFVAYTREQVAAVFGPGVAEAAMAEPEGTWSAPVRSAYGWHLVRVETRTAESRPELGAVRERVRQAWQTERAEHEAAASLQALRRSYRIEVDPSVQARLQRGEPGRS